MNKIMKKIYLSVLTLGLTVVALGTTTFAWFTLTNVSTIQPFTADVVADEGLEIRLAMPGGGTRFHEDWAPEERWVTTLTTEMIEDYIEGYYNNFLFSGMTSPDGMALFQLGASSPDNFGATNSYIAFDLDFRSNSIDEVRWLEASLDSSVQAFVTPVTFNIKNGVEVEAGTPLANLKAAYSARLSVSNGTDATVIEAGARGTGNTANTILGERSEEDLSATLNFGALDYYLQVVSVYPAGFDNVTTPETIALDTNGALDTPPVVLTMVADPDPLADFTYSGTITVRIWLEGWDPDMYNAILSGDLTVSFKFGE